MSGEIDQGLISRALDTWGNREQTMICIEEMSELTKALCKHFRNPSMETNFAILDELADVLITLEYIKAIHGNGYKQMIERKLERLELRVRVAEKIRAEAQVIDLTQLKADIDASMARKDAATDSEIEASEDQGHGN